MSTPLSLVTVTTLVFLSFLQISSCLNCYVCVSANRKEKCNDPFNKANHTGDVCINPSDVCVKEKLNPVGSLAINMRRGCSTADYCKTIGAKSLHCSTCDKDLCNSTVSFIGMPYSSITLTSLSAVVVLRTIFKRLI